ncbi:Bug family tripartite tricarboxylate transporter substrate binding protein [Paracandidimonas soli]|uniref:Tripartite-type tricarboxylate transporter receptor subunit TctC n=1 Tax=Paracandidimonas soli TaxID=1917182 RepID=A0A4R3V176_9BURK|nr:tripartite tricarboxylate transporter substrate binding protein [Paracandidimonas soli]TCU97181.1 tripartite-type tricarboxylate transporter receptor subunit TctC [Paracandidimonas soli]
MRSLHRRAVMALCGLLFTAFQGAAAASEFPSRAITIVVGWSAGGATDLLARQLGESMAKAAGQSIIVENKAGANGTIGHSQAARSRADGYTALLATNSTFAIAPHLYPSLPFDQQRDLAPVSLVAESPLVLVSSPNSGIKTLSDLLEKAKARPGVLNVASGGNGSTSHMAAEMLMALTGINLSHIPYKGGSPATVAVSASEVDVAFLDLGVALPLLKEGRLNPLGVSSTQRSNLLPNVPTLSESGVKDFVATTTFAMFVPIDTPVDVVKRLHGIVDTAMQDQALLDKLTGQGVIPRNEGPEGLGKYVSEEQQRWKDIISSRNITLD